MSITHKILSTLEQAQTLLQGSIVQVIDLQCALYMQVEGGASVFSFSPCFFHADVGALEAFATGINIGASLLSVSPSGLTIQPQALSITPVSPDLSSPSLSRMQ